MLTKSSLLKFYNDYFNYITGVIIILLTAYAVYNRFVQDDAFISFRYAENFVNGHGLVWNIGEKVEGYTNFLWVILISIAIFFRMDPVLFVYIIGPVIFITALIFIFKLAEIILDSKNLALITITLLGINYSFSGFATGGMETILQTTLTAITVYIFIQMFHKNDWQNFKLLILSITMLLGFLTRMDSVLLYLLPVIIITYSILKSDYEAKIKYAKLSYLLLPAITGITLWLIWKFNYYGDIFPNTFYLKAKGIFAWKLGINYLYKFFESYKLLILLAILIPGLVIRFRNNKIPHILAGIILIWFAYLIKIGGDFIEFRMVMPVLPYLFILFVWALFRFITNKYIGTVLIIWIIASSCYYTYYYRTFNKNIIHEGRYFINSIPDLHNKVNYPHYSWSIIGQILGELFNYDPDISIAVKPVGATAYYSRLTVVDLLGLNDKWIAKNGISFLAHPSHAKLASLKYLEKRKTNFILISNYYDIRQTSDIEEKVRKEWFNFLKPMCTETYHFKHNPRIVLIPITSKAYFPLLYIHPTNKIDTILNSKHFQTFPLFKNNREYVINKKK